MNKIHDTLSVCEHCFRHVPATLFERDNQIFLKKTCKVHGESEHLVEPDGEFYLGYNYKRRPLTSYFIEITNHCNLTCPHCYQEPDNTQTDPSIEYLLDKIKSWPDDGLPVALVGAEPTTRKDLPELIEQILQLPGKPREIMVLTNGVYLSKIDYAAQFVKYDRLKWTIGLNHPDYQGHTVRRKQMEAIENCVKLDLHLKGISYTLEDMSQMEYCLKETQVFGNTIASQYRIRCGAEIGRFPGGPKLYMSDLVKEVKRICKENNWTIEMLENTGNRSHYSLLINNVPTKIIQWPDSRTLDLNEVQTEAIADILPNKPLSPLVHQVILRDGLINKKLPLYDTIPQEYIDNYGNHRNQ